MAVQVNAQTLEDVVRYLKEGATCESLGITREFADGLLSLPPTQLFIKSERLGENWNGSLRPKSYAEEIHKARMGY